MSQVITKQFDGTRKAIFTMNFKIASTTAETYTIVPSALNNSKGWATGATANSGDVCTNLTSLNNGGNQVNVYAQFWLNETTDTGAHDVGWIFEAIAN